MRTPVLVPVASAHPSVQQVLPALPEREGVELFVVVREGLFAGERWGTGEVLVCRGEARQGDSVVLVAKGQGRPRLGRVEGARFRGDGGEPCHPARWRAAGRLVAAYRQRGTGWVVDLSVGQPTAPAAQAVGQLSLFAA